MDPTETPTPLSRALDTIKRLKAQLDAIGATQPLAVIGVGMRLPGDLDSLADYWSALASGRDLVGAMPAARRAAFSSQWEGLPTRGGFLRDVLGFDAPFFGISPREARALDPQHRLLLEVSWEALEDAALPPDRLPRERVGLYVGVTGQDYRDWQPDGADAYWATGNGHCFAAGRLAYALGCTGPAIAVDTACSSGLVGVHLACQALRRGECDLAIAGAVNLIMSPRSTRLVRETRALSADGVCRAFDARANGFVRGEGCGAVVLKRLDRARRDGDRIHAVIHGSAVNQDGRSSGFTAPNVRSQIALIEAALADAALTPADIGVVEAHGTGTALGDPIEMHAIAEALGRRNGGAPLWVGSVKPSLGHLEAAAGIAGLLKAIACCSRRAVPPVAHFRTLSPRIDLTGTNIQIPMQLTPWPADGAGRFAGVSAFGLSGTNAHVIIGAAEPEAPVAPVAVAGVELAAKSPAALRAMAARLSAHLAQLSDEDYAAFAYSVTAGRTRHDVRAWIAAETRADAITGLAELAAESATAPRGSAAPPALAELPRRVISLPHYPWERAPYAPEALAGGAGPMPAPAAPAPLAPTPLRAAAPRSPGAMRGMVRRLVGDVLGHRPDVSISDRARFFDLGLDSIMAVEIGIRLSEALGIDVPFAQVYECPTVESLAAALQARLPAAAASRARGGGAVDPEAASRASPPRLALLFSCQGGLRFGMGRELYECEPAFRAELDACDRALAPHLGASVRELMWGDGGGGAMLQPEVAQPALVTLELALAALWRSWGAAPAVVFGHSLGEVAAAIYAGAIAREPGLALVAARARAMGGAAPGAMLAVSASVGRLAEYLRGAEVDVAAINGPSAVVLSGPRAVIGALAHRLEADGVPARVLAVGLASHSRVMAPALAPFQAAIAHLPVGSAAIPMIAGTTGGVATPGQHDLSYWCRQLREPVQFQRGMESLRAMQIEICLEIGPGATLIDLAAAGGLLPHGGGVASLRRAGSELASVREAAALLRRVGAVPAVGADRVADAAPGCTAPWSALERRIG